jgi:hypothetical protein
MDREFYKSFKIYLFISVRKRLVCVVLFRVVIAY